MKSVADTHKLKIAIDSVRMSLAMRGVMGGPTLAEAMRYLSEHGHCHNCGQRNDLPHIDAYHPQPFDFEDDDDTDVLCSTCNHVHPDYLRCRN